MKKKLLIGLVVFAVLLQTSMSFAAGAKKKKKKYGESKLKAGTTEVSVNYTGDYNSAGVKPFIGYFISDEIEIGGGFSVETGDYEGSGYTTTALMLLGRFNVATEDNLVLFGEAGIEQVNVDQGAGGVDRTAFILGVGGRVFPSDAFSLNFSLNYIIGSYDSGATSTDTDSIRLGMGLSVFIF